MRVNGGRAPDRRRRQGVIRNWNAEKGFGFIEYPGQRDVFCHISDVHGVVPVPGTRVEFREIQVEGKGPRAIEIRPVDGATAAVVREPPRRAPGRRSRSSSAVVCSVLLVAWIGMLGWGWHAERVSLWMLGALVVLNAVTYFVYAMDKQAARRGAWRTQESTLHLLALLGGWPAAWAGQQTLRHKTVKREFRVAYWATVLLNCAALAALVFAT